MCTVIVHFIIESWDLFVIVTKNSKQVHIILILLKLHFTLEPNKYNLFLDYVFIYHQDIKLNWDLNLQLLDSKHRKNIFSSKAVWLSPSQIKVMGSNPSNIRVMCIFRWIYTSNEKMNLNFSLRCFLNACNELIKYGLISFRFIQKIYD